LWRCRRSHAAAPHSSIHPLPPPIPSHQKTAPSPSLPSVPVAC
jgi:hypothetical protein